MDWLSQHWQTIVAVIIVALTVAAFARRFARPGKQSGCGEGCGCDGKDRKSVGEGKSVELGGRRILKKKKAEPTMLHE